MGVLGWVGELGLEEQKPGEQVEEVQVVEEAPLSLLASGQ